MAYTRVNWENLPSTNTPVNATNLNKMDAGIANAVEKTGDTMTGELVFNNPSEYEAITKKRTNNNVDYRMILGVGGTGVIRLERREGTAGSGQSLEVRDDGLYSGASGKKLAEQSTGWTNATLSSYITGTVRYVKIGNIVIVNFSDVQVNSNLSHAVVLASGLPTSTAYQMTVLHNFTDQTKQPIRLAINTSGQIVDHYSTNTASNNSYYGTLIYVTNQ